jgi:hypothetical protein
MADARVQELPLVTTGDSDFVEHDFYAIFSSLRVLNYDTKIAAVVRILGWCGMLTVVGWLAFLSLRKQEGCQGRAVVSNINQQSKSAMFS